MQLRGNLKPNQVSWSGYDCENQFVWNSNGVYYNSAIMYIINVDTQNHQEYNKRINHQRIY